MKERVLKSVMMRHRYFSDIVSARSYFCTFHLQKCIISAVAGTMFTALPHMSANQTLQRVLLAAAFSAQVMTVEQCIA